MQKVKTKLNLALKESRMKSQRYSIAYNIPILFLIGLIFTSSGIGLYLYSREGVPRPLESGLLIETDPRDPDIISDVHFVISIIPTSDIFDLELYFVSSQAGLFQIAIFTPYQISNIKNVLSTDNQPNWQFWNNMTGSLILASFNVTNGTQSQSAIGKIQVTHQLSYSNYGVYTVDLPFGTYYSYDLQRLKSNLSLQTQSPSNIYGQVKVSFPSEAILTQKSHEINDRQFNADNQQITILLNKMENVFVQYAIPNETGNSQNFVFVSGILIGVGLPLILTSSFEINKEKRTQRALEKMPKANEGKNFNLDEIHSANRYELVIKKEEPKTIKEKIDNLINKIDEDQQVRIGERFLARVDQFNNVLLTLSVFLFGLLISQYKLIFSNPLVSSPIIVTILAMIFSFSLGTYATFENTNEIRILSWSLVFSCLILMLMILLVAISTQYLNVFFKSNILSLWILPIVTVILSVFLTSRFSKWLENKFASKKLEIHETKRMNKLISIIAIPVFVFAVGIIISLLMYLFQANLL